LSTLFLLLFVSGAFAQRIPFRHQNNADSIVTYFLSERMFHQHVSLDVKESYSSNGQSFFQYRFRHPKFSGEPHIIAFTLDSRGRLVPGKETHGFIKVDSISDTKWIDAREALAICRRQGKIKRKAPRLAWDSTAVSYDTYRKSGNLRDVVPGTLVWQIDGKVKFRGEMYSGTFEVDVMTGKVFRKFAVPWD
jgi:hypothetical protein